MRAVLRNCMLSCAGNESVELISRATISNWNRIGNNMSGRLTTRANKKLSEKRVIPFEYFSNAKNTVIAEQVIEKFLQMQIEPKALMYSTAIKQFQASRDHRKATLRLLEDYKSWHDARADEIVRLCSDERDWLGCLYQSILSEGQRNQGGIYYTNDNTSRCLTRRCMKNRTTKFLDPCCGGGSLFFSLSEMNPENIYGIDKDPIAVFIAKVNLLRIFSDIDFEPQIFCTDYLHPTSEDLTLKVFHQKFDFIATNPPWGAVNEMVDKLLQKEYGNETFALFYIKAYGQLRANGVISFLLPESAVNIKTHTNFRKFVLENGCLERVTYYTGVFSGVVTHYIGIEVVGDNNKGPKIEFLDQSQSGISMVCRSDIESRLGLEFVHISADDQKILDRMNKIGTQKLNNSEWALGVVTGDNKNKLLSSPERGMEPIYTGKEVVPFLLNPAQKYLLFDRKHLQQVAQDRYYRAPEKLVYRFIADRPIFAYDNSKSLFLNSANILIPNVKGLDIKTVMAFLNSDVLGYYYQKRFGGVKVLKSNLCELPMPSISKEMNNKIKEIVESIMQGDNTLLDELQLLIGSCYGFSSNEISQIRNMMHGKAD